MQIKRLAATFGRLENEVLELAPGLNIIEAPNEGGKSTWTALLRVLFYGLNTRDRSPAADKRRYAPWSSSAMQGTMEVASPLGDVTITRSTARTNSPMGAFSAVYTGTGTPVPSLSSSGCGEALLGVPQEIYERSAYIRQSGIAVDQNAALERRIAALITTGEEDTSYSDAADRLKKQLTRRRYNKSGLLPQLEQQITGLRDTLSEMERLQEQLRQAEDQERALRAEEARLTGLLARHDAADRAQQAARLAQARHELERAQEQSKAVKQGTAGLPPRQELASIRAAIDAQSAADQAVSAAREAAEAAARRLKQSEATLADHPLAGHTPEEAEQLSLAQPPRPAASPLWFCLAALAAAVTVGLVQYFSRSWLAAAGSGAGLLGLLLLLLSLPLRRRQAAWDTQHDKLLQSRREELAAYTLLYTEADGAREAARSAQAALRAAAASRDSSAERILSRVRLFRSGIHDLSTARAAVEEGLGRYDALGAALQTESAARMRWEFLAENTPQTPVAPVERPAVPREQLQEELSDVTGRNAELRRRIDTLRGRLQAAGDPILLRAELEQKAERRSTVQREYDAISLAMGVLSDANTELQNRFSPELGEKSAKIFTKLTKGKYNKVLLNREMTPSAQEAGQFIPRQAALLSQGAADQLYLAVRLAICEMVLPPEQAAPIILDDALVTFDDGRCAAALDYLTELARQRQILLFTCQGRELAYLRSVHPGQYHAITL